MSTAPPRTANTLKKRLRERSFTSRPNVHGEGRAPLLRASLSTVGLGRLRMPDRTVYTRSGASELALTLFERTNSFFLSHVAQA